MAGPTSDRRWAAPGWAAVVAVVVAGTVLVVHALTAAPAGPPAPSLAAAPRFGPSTDPGAAPPAGPLVAASPAGPSLPVRLRVPAIGVSATVLPVGIEPDGSVQVPPADRPDVAGWYAPGPTPGEAGNAVLVGHVDSRTSGPGVFFELGRLEPGDEITVSRHDGSVGRFRVYGVASYRKAEVPGAAVFGPAATPGLRLITCGGPWDPGRRSYADNVVAYATLVAWDGAA